MPPTRRSTRAGRGLAGSLARGAARSRHRTMPTDERARRCDAPCDLARAARRRFGHGLRIGRAALGSSILETFEIGDGVFIGEQAFIQGRFDGTLRDRRSRLDRAAELLRRARPGDRGLRRLGPGREGARIQAHGHAGSIADHPDRSRDQAGADRAWADIGVNAVDPAGRDDRQGRHRRRRRGRDARRASRFRSWPACRRGSSGGAGRRSLRKPQRREESDHDRQ